MTMFKKCRGIHREKRLGSKWPEAVEGEWQSRGGSGYRAGRRATTHMEARGWCGWEIWIVLGWSIGWQRSDYCVIGGCLLCLSLC